MDVAAFDLEEMDEAERQELEALLYAQVHHAAPEAAAVAEPGSPAAAAALKTEQLRASAGRPEQNRVLTNGSLRLPPPAVGERAGAVQAESEPATGDGWPALRNTAATAGAQDSCDRAAAKAASNSPPDDQTTTNGPRDSDDVKSTSDLMPAAKRLGSRSRRPDTGAAASPRPAAPAADSAAASPARRRKRPLSPASSGGEPETKTAALAAGERRRRRRAAETVPAPDLSGSSSDEYIRPAAERRPLAADSGRRRPRTSSDLSSSGDSDGGAALEVRCDLRVNARGEAGDRASQAEVVEQTESAELALPAAACRGVLSAAALSQAERRLLEPLCQSRPCFKWSDRQRAGYTTPRQYGSGDVHSIQAAMSERGWDIPAEYLRSGGKTARARYYSNIMKNRCRRCDGRHALAACPLPPVCHLCGRPGHSAQGRCPNAFCYMCGRRDHQTQRCPRHVQPVFCALCKAAGHASDQCSDRWRRYHATTSAGPPVQPPPSLEQRRARRLFCWECGRRGHRGHHCGGQRYTSAASLSQQVISYTETSCASREVAGIVATPAQMDAVFAPGRHRRLERDTGATLTYEQLGDKAWLINFSGGLEAAWTAHRLVQEILQGSSRSQRRPRSAPGSPARLAEPEGTVSLPASPGEAKQAARLRRAEARRRRRAAHATPAPLIDVEAGSVDVIDVDSGSGDVIDVDCGSGDVIDVDSGSGDVIDVDSGSGDVIDIDSGSGDVIDVDSGSGDVIDVDSGSDGAIAADSGSGACRSVGVVTAVGAESVSAGAAEGPLLSGDEDGPPDAARRPLQAGRLSKKRRRRLRKVGGGVEQTAGQPARCRRHRRAAQTEPPSGACEGEGAGCRGELMIAVLESRGCAVSGSEAVCGLRLLCL